MDKKIFTSKDSKIQLSVDSSLLGDDKPDIWGCVNTWIKNVGIAALILLIAWGVVGTPYLRWDEPLNDSKDGTDLKETDLAFTRYVSVGDSRRVYAGEYGVGLPWLIFIPIGDPANGAAGDGDDLFDVPGSKSGT